MAEILTSLSLPSPAKLNLFLHIVGRDPSTGYHQLETLFQLVDLCDYMTFVSRQDQSISIQGMPEMPLESNLIFKAAERLQKRYCITQGVDIAIEKRIPAGGGLGGGSSNAATTLLALNRLWQINAPTETLSEIGLALGADVPVFIHGHSAWAKGIGEKLTPVCLPLHYFVIIYPNIFTSTALIFNHPQLKRDTLPIPFELSQLPNTRNDCETVSRILFSEISLVFEFLNQFGSAKLTGTGSCCFLSVETLEKAKKILQYMPHCWTGFVAQSIDVSPAVTFGS